MHEVEQKRQVTNLAEYRKQKIHKAPRYPKDPVKVLDEVSHYLLLAAKAISNQTKK